MGRTRVIVSGLVQGVFYRDTCRREADRLAITGWVRNRVDGTVEAVFEGDPDAVTAMVDWCRHGPPDAQVRAVHVHAEQPTGLRDFVIKHR